METKICKKCGRELPLSEFYKSKGCKDGHRNECKECFIQQRKQQSKQYYQEHKEEIAEHSKQYYQDNKEAFAEHNKQYYQEHKEEIVEQRKQYYQTQMGRALYLVSGYRQDDKKYNRGECTLTTQWIIDNIFSGQKCIFCGKDDWTKLGCDRIDNSKPHTPDNVNPCCGECNTKRGKKEFEEFRSCMQNSF